MLLLELLENQVRTLEETVKSYNYQLLANADQVEKIIADKGLKDLDKLVEHLIKHPLRRQIGRLRGVKCALEEIKRKIKEKPHGQTASPDLQRQN